MSETFSRRNFLRLVGCALGGGMLYLVLRPHPAYAAGVRPPGARPEPHFQALCIHCGACAAACDQRAIQITADGLPRINGLSGWCDFCLRCVDACPTGALSPVNPAQARLGAADINRSRCIAWQWPGCRLCYEECAQLWDAIWLDEDYRPHVDETRCVGCGACVVVCPQSAREGMNRESGKAVSLR